MFHGYFLEWRTFSQRELLFDGGGEGDHQLERSNALYLNTKIHIGN